MNEDSKYCEWTRDDYESNIWQGQCGLAFILEQDTPVENEMTYCPKCGKLLKTVLLPNNPIKEELDD
jgi:hypothetical protein